MAPTSDKLPIEMLNDRLLVSLGREDGERRSSGGILIPATAQQSKRLVWAAVVALGPNVRSVQAGDKVLINGASGGVGTFAVQIAKAMGAEVTGVCSTRNVELVRSLGADHVVDYKHEDFTRRGTRYDVIIDNVGNHSLRDVRRVLVLDGTYVKIGGPKHDPWLGPVLGFLSAPVMSKFSSQSFEVLLAQMNADDLRVLAGMIDAGQLTPVIDRSYALDEIPAAIDYLASQRARGKVVAVRR